MSIPPPYKNDDVHSFAHTSVSSRWPAIIDGMIADLSTASAPSEGERKEEAEKLIQDFRTLKADIVAGAKLEPFPDSFEHDRSYNEELAKYPGVTWANAPWLLSECYLYRKAQRAIDASSHWCDYDMFSRLKRETFFQSSDAVSSLSARYVAISKQLQELGGFKIQDAVVKVLLREILDISLWGNATDLSLLVTVSLEQLKKLQVAVADRDKEAVLSNDFDKAEKALISTPGGRIDVVLDNSGFELFTDVIMALFFLDTGIAEQVVFHPKNQPWFVSDVTPRDWLELVNLLRDDESFPLNREAIDTVLGKLLYYSSEGSLLIRSNAFWTTPLPFWELKKGGRAGGDAAWRDLRGTKLVIFKGDLNYRKLTGDRTWNRSTSFKEAVQTTDVELLSLRTIKADVCVGLPEGKEADLAAHWVREHPDQGPEAWAWSGSYAVVSYHDPSA